MARASGGGGEHTDQKHRMSRFHAPDDRFGAVHGKSISESRR